MTTLIVLETVLLAVLTVLVAGLLRAYGTVLRRLHELDGGAPDAPRQFDLLPLTEARPAAPRAAPGPAPSPARFGPAHDVAGETLAGEVASARVVGVEHDTLLLFLSSGCASCATFWRELGAGSVPLPSRTRLLVIAQSALDESLADLREVAPPNVDVLLSSDAWRDYEVPGSPHVVYVDGPSGRIRGEGTGQSLAQVTALLARSTGDATLVAGDRAAKPARDLATEEAVDRELLAAGILPGDPRLYGDEA